MDNKPDELMLFAAGFGTRMQPLTDHIPKPLIKVAGQTLLDRTLDLANEAGINHTVVNTHYRGGVIKEHLKATSVSISHEKNILDTGGGLKNALGAFRGKAVFTSNSDAVWSGENPFSYLSNNWNDDCDALLLCAPIDKVSGRKKPGDFSLSKTGAVKRSGDAVYLGVQIIKLSALKDINDTVFSLNLVWDTLISRGKLKAVTYTGQWCDIGMPENITLGERLLEHKIV